MEKITIKIIAAIIGAIILGFFSFGYFTGYGGSRCDISFYSDPANYSNMLQLGSCDCFCCQGFYGQGYESCGMFGLFSGWILGAPLGLLITHLILRKLKK